MEFSKEGVATEFVVWRYGMFETPGGVVMFDEELAQRLVEDSGHHADGDGWRRIMIAEPHDAAEPRLPDVLGWASLEAREDGLWATRVVWGQGKAARARTDRYAVCAFHLKPSSPPVQLAVPASREVTGIGPSIDRVVSLFLTNTPLPGVSRPIPLLIDGRVITTAENEPAERMAAPILVRDVALESTEEAAAYAREKLGEAKVAREPPATAPPLGTELFTFPEEGMWIAAWRRRDVVAQGATEREAFERLIRTIAWQTILDAETGSECPVPAPEVVAEWERRHNEASHDAAMIVVVGPEAAEKLTPEQKAEERAIVAALVDGTHPGAKS